MATIDPNESVTGGRPGQTTGDVLGTAGNPEQQQSFDDFLGTASPYGEGGTLQSTNVPGVYTLTTNEGIFQVVNTDEAPFDFTPTTPLGPNSKVIFASSEDIQLLGSSGNDKILFGTGNDTVIGGGGNDVFGGGAGYDTFLYVGNIDNSADVITDFAQGDTLGLSDFNGDGVFDANDFSVQETPDGVLLTFAFGRGSVLLQGVTADQLNPATADGQVTLRDTTPHAAQNVDLSDASHQSDVSHHNDDDTFFTIT